MLTAIVRRRSAIASWALVVAAIVILVIGAVRPADLESASYTASSTTLRLFSILVAGGWIAAAVLAGSTGRPLAVPLALTGLLWTVPEWAGWTGASAWMTWAAQTAAVLLPSLALWAAAVIAGVDERLRWAAGALVGVGAIAALTWDSFDATGCWRACAPALIALPGGGKGLLLAAVGATMIAAVALPWMVPADRRRSAIGVVAAVAAIPLAFALVAQLVPPNSIPSSLDGPPRGWAPWLAQFAALACVACAGWRRCAAFMVSLRLSRLATDIHRVATPAGLERELRSAVRDPFMTVAWWSPSTSAWVDGSGHAVSAGMPATRNPQRSTVTTTVRRAERPLAAITHQASLPPERLVESLRPAMVLSFENARLQAATTAELHAARTTALRVVERSEAEGRVLQRNLHDGAQQRLVGLAMAVRRIRPTAGEGGDPTAMADLIPLLDDADGLVASIIAQVRRVAHRIHPALLADIGLGPALRELADTISDVLVRVVDGPDGPASADRPGAAVEAAAYEAAVQGIQDARRRGASCLEIRLRPGLDDTLSMVMLDDGIPATVGAPSIGVLDDQVEALGGRLRVERQPAALSVDRREPG